MKTKIFAVLAIAGVSWLLTGCVNTADGRKQMGSPVGKDTIQANYMRPVTQVFEAAKAVLSAKGKLVAENTINHSLEAKVDQETVFVRVDPTDPVKPVTALTVQARTRARNGDITLAADIDKQIALKLVEMESGAPARRSAP